MITMKCTDNFHEILSEIHENNSSHQVKSRHEYQNFETVTPDPMYLSYLLGALDTERFQTEKHKNTYEKLK